jgi:hypothetical protein
LRKFGQHHGYGRQRHGYPGPTDRHAGAAYRDPITDCYPGATYGYCGPADCYTGSPTDRYAYLGSYADPGPADRYAQTGDSHQRHW